MVPAPETAADTAPLPLSVAPLLNAIPEASASEPPSSWIWPALTVSAAPIVRLPAAPISSVWLALLIAIARVDVAVPSILRSDPAAVAISSRGPLTVPVRASVPPLAVTVPLPDNEPAALPQPDRLLLDKARAIPPASLILPPAMVICPAVMLIAVLLVPVTLRVALPIASVALASLMDKEFRLGVAETLSVSV